MERITVCDKIYDEERALYGLSSADVSGCRFEGEADGESALKEARDVKVRGCTFRLRYPLWHVSGFTLTDSVMTDTCRAPLWYASDGLIENLTLTGVKCLRECDRITLKGCDVTSAEFGWRCRGITIDGGRMESEYFFFESKNLTVKNLTMKGKYSFQYVEGMTIEDSVLDTKDSFWHAKDVTVRNSTVRGEYLGWYAENLTLENCRIIGTQPFCYCKNLKLSNCTMEGCDLAFEYSSVEADVKGHIDSVKNPLSGRITADSIGEIIRGNTVYECDCEIVRR